MKQPCHQEAIARTCGATSALAAVEASDSDTAASATTGALRSTRCATGRTATSRAASGASAAATGWGAAGRGAACGGVVATGADSAGADDRFTALAAILSGAGAGGGVTCELGADVATFSAFCAAFSIGRGAVVWAWGAVWIGSGGAIAAFGWGTAGAAVSTGAIGSTMSPSGRGLALDWRFASKKPSIASAENAMGAKRIVVMFVRCCEMYKRSFVCI